MSSNIFDLIFFSNYNLNGNEIFNKEKNCFISLDNEISVLGLSIVIEQILHEVGFNKLSKLLKTTYELLKYYNLSDEQIEEINRKFKKYLLEREKENFVYVADKKIDSISDNIFVSNIDPESLLDNYSNIFSDRALDTFYRNGLYKVKDLLSISIDDIKYIKSECYDVIKSFKIKYNIYYDNGKIGFYDIENIGNIINLRDGKIFLDEEQYIENILVEKFTINQYYIETLIKNEFVFLSDIFLNFDKFKAISSFGKNKIKTIKAYLKDYCFNNVIFKGNIRVYLSKEVLKIIDQAKFDGITEAELIETFNRLYDEELVHDVIETEIEKRTIFRYEDKLFCSYMSFAQWVYLNVTDPQMRDILFSRLDGITLEELGAKYGVTRERIRQKCAKFLENNHILEENKQLYFKDDRFGYIFSNYYILKDEFRQIFKLNDRTYNYLCLAYKKGSLQLEKIIDDDKVFFKHRQAIFKYTKRNFYNIDDIYLPKNINALIHYFGSLNPNSQLQVEEYSKQFCDFLSEKGIDAKNYNIRTVYNIIQESKFFLLSYNKKFRYYNYTKYDFERFFEVLGFQNYDNTIMSTEYLFETYNDLMIEYNIRDFYELHNVIRKHSLNRFSNLNIGRMPYILFGEDFSKEKAIEEIIDEFGMLTKKQLIKEIRKRFCIGSNIQSWEDVVPTNEFGYYVSKNRIPPLNDEERKILSSLFAGDFYTNSQIKKMIFSNCKDFDYKKLTATAFLELGYEKRDHYIVKNGFKLIDYLRNIIETNDFVTNEQFEHFLNTSSSGYTYLRTSRNNLNLFDFDNETYITITKLEKLGLSKEIIKDEIAKFVANIKKMIGNDEYFNIHYLRRRGIEIPFDEYGFEDRFYESLLISSDEFAYISTGKLGPRIFVLKGNNISKLLIMKKLLGVYRKLSIEKLEDVCNELYGNFFLKNIQFEPDNDCFYFDNTIKTFYIDYRSFVEDL